MWLECGNQMWLQSAIYNIFYVLDVLTLLLNHCAYTMFCDFFQQIFHWRFLSKILLLGGFLFLGKPKSTSSYTWPYVSRRLVSANLLLTASLFRSFSAKKTTRYGPTDWRTDTPSYKVAYSQLKTFLPTYVLKFNCFLQKARDSRVWFEKSNLSNWEGLCFVFPHICIVA